MQFEATLGNCNGDRSFFSVHLGYDQATWEGRGRAEYRLSAVVRGLKRGHFRGESEPAYSAQCDSKFIATKSLHFPLREFVAKNMRLRLSPGWRAMTAKMAPFLTATDNFPSMR